MSFIASAFYRRFHFYMGNLYRLLTSAIYQKEINIAHARTLFAASFGDDGWHHIRNTLREYDENPEIDYRNTSMFFFLKNFTPNSICDLIKDDAKEKCRLPLFTYPWGTFSKNSYVSNKDPNYSRFCGPSSDAFIEKEFDSTIKLYEKIKKTGYQPWLYGNSFIGGTFLISKSSEKRFIVLQGNHRLAILAHLGYENIQVRDVKGYLKQISERDVLSWVLVKSGLCTENTAISIFEIFFKENGIHLDKLLQNQGK